MPTGTHPEPLSYFMTVALEPFAPSWYATYGTPLEARARLVQASEPAEKPAVPTSAQSTVTVETAEQTCCT